jgi:hypothetical protein
LELRVQYFALFAACSVAPEKNLRGHVEFLLTGRRKRVNDTDHANPDPHSFLSPRRPVLDTGSHPSAPSAVGQDTLTCRPGALQRREAWTWLQDGMEATWRRFLGQHITQ